MLKIKNTAFLYFPGSWHGLHSYEVGSLQHIRFPQCTINEARK